MGIASIDPASPVPPFEQVRSQVADAITSGELSPEVRLPTVRVLAGDLGLAVNTVAKAYRELEMAGLIETHGRRGTFVAGAPSQQRRLAVQAAREFVGRAQALGIGPAEMLAIVRREAAPPSPASGPAAVPTWRVGPG